MTQLLIIGSKILAQGPFTDTGDSVKSADAIYPKIVISGYAIVDVTLPADFSLARYQWVNGALSRNPDSPAAVSAAKTTKIAQVEALAASKRNSVVSPTSPAEMASWPIKRDEAAKFKASVTAQVPAGDPTLAPNLSNEATARGIALSALADKVIAKSNQLATLEAQIAGNTGKHNDAINALTTINAINAYDFSGGWPV